MKKSISSFVASGLMIALFQHAGFAQHKEKNITLHVNPTWKECSIQLDPSLTQDAWHQFTQEAGLVAYFRPLRDATSMGVGRYEFSILQWTTKLDDTQNAWNDTFVHPDSTHWLTEGAGLGFPGLTFRTGITEKLDAGVYWTKNFEANYGFWGGQVQYAFIQGEANDLAASGRMSFVSLYGPDDLGLNVVGLELLASKRFDVYSDWVSISPYAGVSTYLSNSHETTTAVDLQDEHVVGIQGMAGAVAHISMARVAAEYNVARVHSFSLKVGIEF